MCVWESVNAGGQYLIRTMLKNKENERQEKKPRRELF